MAVIGIPAGVKIHSAVYATTPLHAGELINLILSGAPMSLHDAQVMDLDEQAFREGKVVARCYGYLSVPVDDTRMQLIKQGGLNHQQIALQDIATEIIESMEPDVFYLIGSGSTTAEIMNQLSLENTLLGIDIVCNQQLIASDVDEKTIIQTINNHPAKIIVTVIGGQGHVFGRGNQQLSAKVIDQIGRENIIIVATNEKLRTLNKRPMIADTGDADLDKQLAGLYPVISGYQQKTLYKLN
jgi:predicted polyphosphate/ATP-dependent NAD kinase